MLVKLFSLFAVGALVVSCTNSGSGNSASPQSFEKSQIMGAWELTEVELPGGARASAQQPQSDGTTEIIQIDVKDGELLYVWTRKTDKESTFHVNLKYTLENKVIKSEKTDGFKIPDYEVTSVDANTLKLRDVNPSEGATKDLQMIFKKIPAEQLRKEASDNGAAVSANPEAQVVEKKIVPPMDIPKTLKCSTSYSIVTIPKEVILSISQEPLRIRVYEPGKKASILKIQAGSIDVRGNVTKADELTTCEVSKKEHTENRFQLQYTCTFYPYGPQSGQARGSDSVSIDLFKSARGLTGATRVINHGQADPWASFQLVSCEAVK